MPCLISVTASGVYNWVHMESDKRYVGSSKEILARMNAHLGSLRLGTHFNKHLQNAWNKYGEASFRFEIVELISFDEEDVEGSKAKLIDRETFWIGKYRSWDRGYGYNMKRIANSSLGVKFSEESKDKLSASLKGYYADEEVRAAHAEIVKKSWEDPKNHKARVDGMKKKFAEPEFRRRKSAKSIEMWQRLEYQAKMAKIMNSEEARNHNSEMTKRVWGDEAHQEKMRQIHLERCKRPDEIARMTAMRDGLWDDEERRRIQAEKIRALWKDPVYRANMLEARRQGRLRRKLNGEKTLWD